MSGAAVKRMHRRRTHPERKRKGEKLARGRTNETAAPAFGAARRRGRARVRGFPDPEPAKRLTATRFPSDLSCPNNGTITCRTAQPAKKHDTSSGVPLSRRVESTCRDRPQLVLTPRNATYFIDTSFRVSQDRRHVERRPSDYGAPPSVCQSPFPRRRRLTEGWGRPCGVCQTCRMAFAGRNRWHVTGRPLIIAFACD